MLQDPVALLLMFALLVLEENKTPHEILEVVQTLRAELKMQVVDSKILLLVILLPQVLLPDFLKEPFSWLQLKFSADVVILQQHLPQQCFKHPFP